MFSGSLLGRILAQGDNGDYTHFSCFDLETVKGLITSAGFAIIETKIEIQVEGGIEIPYHWLLARKP